jgi:Transposase domain (DUF772)
MHRLNMDTVWCQDRSNGSQLGDHAADLLRTAVVQPVDPGAEEALYESAALRRFVGVDLGVAPDETTILRFCHCWGGTSFGLMLDAVNVHV